jgi:diaminopimelate epimerase
MNSTNIKNPVSYSIYSGAGNDFIMINNLDDLIPFNEQSEFTKRICELQFPKIDGVIFLDKPVSENNSIRMSYYNRDGSYGAMCGNGARCIAQFAVDNKIMEQREFNLEAVDKVYKAQIIGNNIVKIFFPPPDEVKLNIDVKNVNGTNKIVANYMLVGSDHLVIFIKDSINKDIFHARSLDDVDIDLWGNALRFHPDFKPAGANVNFIDILSSHILRIRTYERGVERETLACGTGIISSAVVSAMLSKVNVPVNVLSQSNEWLKVDFDLNNKIVKNLSLEGPAIKISEGEIENITYK